MHDKLGKTSNGSGRELGSPRKAGTNKRLKENEYIVAGTDQSGRSSLVQFRTVPSQLRVLEIVVGQGKFPFKTTTDAMRFCLKFGLDHLLRAEPPAMSLVSYAIMELERLRDEIYLQEQAKPIEALEMVVNNHMKEGTPASEFQALGIVVMAIERARKIKDKVWRERTVKGIERKFDGLLRRKEEIMKSATEKVSLDPIDYEEEDEDE